ncbi:hypothetical protein NQ317_018152 [Molorchus minor]|uniref:Uncharacterized protein n=1 Tax=Molorchus minor TaxID=1323400 RepID=A0ABQ9J2T9_9CUCU|nr:hypothetical protein NQ317_018152 [Molorchus minor]
MMGKSRVRSEGSVKGKGRVERGERGREGLREEGVVRGKRRALRGGRGGEADEEEEREGGGERDRETGLKRKRKIKKERQGKRMRNGERERNIRTGTNLLLCTLVVSSIISPTLADPNQFPFCKICRCHFTDNSASADVTCTTNIQYNIFNDYFWKDQDTNESYAYNSINFQNNKFINLTYIFPPSNLTYLNLANNAIYGIADSVFQNFQNMDTLILSYNDLEIIHPDAFKGVYLEARLMPLRKLKELRLDHNKLHTLNQDIFEHTTDIEILDLSNNPIVTLDQHTVAAIDSLALLKELYLQYTEISTLPDNMLHTPKFLEVMDLSGNPIKEMPATLKQVHNLRELYMNNTGFENLTEDNGFPEMPTVKVLHLCRNQKLTYVKKHSLSGLLNLEELYLCDNIDLVEIDPLALAMVRNHSGGTIWPPIKKLQIGNNKLAYLDSDIIARWDGLSMLDIRGNPWTCECENQWLVEDLIPIYLKIDEGMAREVKCAAPIEMVRYTFYELYKKQSHMRCLDIYGAKPENDAMMLVGVLAGVLIAIPLIFLVIFGYQRRWFGFCTMCDKSPASYTRKFYSTTPSDDYF